MILVAPATSGHRRVSFSTGAAWSARAGNTEMAAEPGYVAVHPRRLLPITDADYVLGDGQH
jgi:hypothetical protein